MKKIRRGDVVVLLRRWVHNEDNSESYGDLGVVSLWADGCLNANNEYRVCVTEANHFLPCRADQIEVIDHDESLLEEPKEIRPDSQCARILAEALTTKPETLPNLSVNVVTKEAIDNEWTKTFGHPTSKEYALMLEVNKETVRVTIKPEQNKIVVTCDHCNSIINELPIIKETPSNG